MAYLNKVMLIGNVGKDPEARMTPANRKRVSFSLATSRRYRDNNNEPKEQTEWHNVVAWGKLADTIEQLQVRKGSCLFVEGSVTYRSWDDQNGQKRYQTEILMDSFQLLTPRNQNGGNYQGGNSYNAGNSYNGGQQSYGRAPQQGGFDSAPIGAPEDMEEDGLPF